jgi:hypothetical protein
MSERRPRSRAPRRSGQKNGSVHLPWIVVGGLFLLLGLAGLVHPRVVMPAQRSEIEVGSQTIKMETRRIVTVPRVLAILMIIGGAGLIYLGSHADAPARRQ